MTRPLPRRRFLFRTALRVASLAAANRMIQGFADAAPDAALPADLFAVVNPQSSQTMQGFGASGAWWPNDLIQFSPEIQERVAGMLFGSDGIRLSGYRYNIGGGGVGVVEQAHATETFLRRELDGMTAHLQAARAEVADLRAALEQIADGDMPSGWHPDNISWWLRGIARKALNRREWVYLGCADCDSTETVCPDCKCCEICDVDLHTDACPRMTALTTGSGDAQANAAALAYPAGAGGRDSGDGQQEATP